MKRRKARTRTLLSGFSSKLGSETLNVRIYREREAFVCEREVVERDGTAFTMVKPFKEPGDVRELLQADPFYPRIQSDVDRALAAFDRVLREHGKRAA